MDEEKTISKLDNLKNKYEKALLYTISFVVFLLITGLIGYGLYELFKYNTIIAIGTVIYSLLILSFFGIRLMMFEEIPVKKSKLQREEYEETYLYKNTKYYIESYNFNPEKYNKFLNMLIINMALIFIYTIAYNIIVDLSNELIIIQIMILIVILIGSYEYYDRDKIKLKILQKVK
jgi:hypothetical protein